MEIVLIVFLHVLGKETEIYEYKQESIEVCLLVLSETKPNINTTVICGTRVKE